MILKLILKLWPSFIPILFYLFWVFIIQRIVIKHLLKNNDVIEGEKVVGEKTTKAKKLSHFSLENRHFLIVLYLSLALGITSLVFSALSNPGNYDSTYVPAAYKDGKIVPSSIK